MFGGIAEGQGQTVVSRHAQVGDLIPEARQPIVRKRRPTAVHQRDQCGPFAPGAEYRGGVGPPRFGGTGRFDGAKRPVSVRQRAKIQAVLRAALRVRPRRMRAKPDERWAAGER